MPRCPARAQVEGRYRRRLASGGGQWHPGGRGDPGGRGTPRARRRRWRGRRLDRIRLEGGCQGCSLAEVTIRQGIEPLLRERLPGVTGVADVTDHEAGTVPFFSPAKR
jgi:hypothetical protein